MKIKNIILISAVLCTAAALATGLGIFFLQKNNAQKDMYTFWQSYFDNKRKQVLEQLKESFTISNEYFEEIDKRLAELKANDPLFTHQAPKTMATWSAPEHPMTKKVVAIALGYGLNPQALNILIIDEPENPAIAHTEQIKNAEGEIVNKIIINNATLSEIPEEGQEALLRHELQHIINYDSVDEWYIWCVLKTLGYQHEDWDTDPAMVTFRQLKELRADQLAGISGGLKIAHAVKDTLALSNDEETFSHPSTDKRVAHMNVVIDHMEKQVTA